MKRYTDTQSVMHHRPNWTRISRSIAAPSVRHTSRLTTWAYARAGAYARNWQALAARTVETSANAAGPNTIFTDNYYN